MPSDRSTADVVTDLWGDSRPLSRRQVVTDACLGAAFALILGYGQLQLSPASGVAAVLLGAALAVRRRLLPAMVVLAVAASGVQVVTGDVAVLANVAYVPLFFTLGSHRVAWVRRFGLACAVIAVIVAGAWGAAHTSGGDTAQNAALLGVGFAAITAVVVGGGWIGGYLRWQRRQAVQARADAVLEAVELRRLRDRYEQEQERGRIAADMHDLVAHSWAVVAAQDDGARYLLRADPDRAAEALVVVADTARSAMTDVRVLLAQLRDRGDPQRSHDNLGPEQSDALFARMSAAGMDLRFERHGVPGPSSLLTMAALRVMSEALTNALKHGDLTRPVQVEEDWRHGYRLRVVNAVVASPAIDVQRSELGHGLIGMAERMTLVGGTLRAGQDGNTWVVEVEVAQTRRLDVARIDVT